MKEIFKRADGVLLKASAFLTALFLSKTAMAESYFDFKDAEEFTKNTIGSGHSTIKSVADGVIAIIAILLFLAILGGTSIYAVSQYNKKREMGQGGIPLIAGYIIGVVVVNALSLILLLIMYKGASKLIAKF